MMMMMMTMMTVERRFRIVDVRSTTLTKGGSMVWALT